MAFFNPHLWTALNRTILNRVKILHVYTSLREKCPDAEFFLVRIFPHLDWIRRDTIWTHLTQCLLILTNSPRNLQDIMFSKDFASRFYNLHNFIQQSLNSGSAQVHILLAGCRKFATVRISNNDHCHKNHNLKLTKNCEQKILTWSFFNFFNRNLL